MPDEKLEKIFQIIQGSIDTKVVEGISAWFNRINGSTWHFRGGQCCERAYMRSDINHHVRFGRRIVCNGQKNIIAIKTMT